MLSIILTPEIIYMLDSSVQRVCGAAAKRSVDRLPPRVILDFQKGSHLLGTGHSWLACCPQSIALPSSLQALLRMVVAV